jgi:hypothetical protein
VRTLHIDEVQNDHTDDNLLQRASAVYFKCHICPQIYTKTRELLIAHLRQEHMQIIATPIPVCAIYLQIEIQKQHVDCSLSRMWSFVGDKSISCHTLFTRTWHHFIVRPDS